MGAAIESLLTVAGKHWRKAAAFLIAALVGGAVYATQLAFRVEAIERKMKGVQQSLKEIREGVTPYQKRRRKHMNRISDKLDRLLRFSPRPEPPPYRPPREFE